MKKQMIIASVLALTLVAGLAASAVAGSATYTAPAAGTVNVGATINSKITMTVTCPDAGQTVEFGTVDPGAVVGGKAVGLSVDSNKAFALAKVVTGDSALMGLSTDQANVASTAKGSGKTFTDNYSLTVPWTTDPGTYAATVQYTVTQN